MGQQRHLRSKSTSKRKTLRDSLLQPRRLCRNVKETTIVIPSLCSRTGLSGAKNLRNSMRYKLEILRLTPQNDITTRPPEGGDGAGLDLTESYGTINRGKHEEVLDEVSVEEGSRHMKELVEKALEKIRPGLQRDGGDIELVDVKEDGVVQVRLTGACGGCPMSQMTLKMGVERVLKQEVPGVTRVDSL